MPASAEQTWQELHGTPQLDLFRTPYFLKLLCDQVGVRKSVPKGRAGLFAGFVRQLLEREVNGDRPLFQLAALLTDRDRQKLTLQQWSTPFELPQTGWEETTLMASVMTRNPDAFVRSLMPENLPLAGRCAAMPESQVTPALKLQIQEALIARSQDMSADLRARIAAGLSLGNLGDPRFERGAGPHGDYLLPPLVTIPKGKYPMGSDEGLYEDESPAHSVTLEAFLIGAFPVTNAEYAWFIASGGYKEERWWQTDAAKAWRKGEGTSDGPKQQWRENRKNLQGMTEQSINDLVKQNRITSKQAEDWITIRNWTEESFEGWLEEQFPSGKRYSEPGFWRDDSFNGPSQPVVGICWHEARAYCAWLSEQSGRRFTLPTEAQFESAARGKSGRSYAYGKEFDSARSNTFESHIRRTTPVGIFQNATPEGGTNGLYDLAGNAWTWTTSEYRRYPYRADDGREDPNTSDVSRVVRGGS